LELQAQLVPGLASRSRPASPRWEERPLPVARQALELEAALSESKPQPEAGLASLRAAEAQPQAVPLQAELAAEPEPLPLLSFA
jgi:hypothetical protein